MAENLSWRGNSFPRITAPGLRGPLGVRLVAHQRGVAAALHRLAAPGPVVLGARLQRQQVARVEQDGDDILDDIAAGGRYFLHDFTPRCFRYSTAVWLDSC